MLIERNSAVQRTFLKSGGGYDARGHLVSQATPQALAAIDAFGDAILRRDQRAEAILDAATASPDCLMVSASAAAYHLLTETRAGFGKAISLLDRAERGLPTATAREALFVAALSAVAHGGAHLAESAFLTLSAEAPDDLVAGYIGHLYFLTHGRTGTMLAHARLLSRANPGDPFALGMFAFALHEVGSVDAALDIATEADAAVPSIAWVHHAVGHVFLSQGDAERGAKWLEARAHHWQRCGSSMLSHNWWHLELLMLELGDVTAVLGLYDRLLAADAASSVSSFIDASSLLARVELCGGDVGTRWMPLAEKARLHLGEHVSPFIDVHYALALARCGDVEACTALSRSAWRHAATTTGRLSSTWKAAGLPLLDAVCAFGLGDGPRALQGFERGLAHLRRLGGSNQQRVLFHEFARRSAEPLHRATGTRIPA